MNKRMSWLKIVNVFFFQWFFVRLTRCSEEKDKVVGFDPMWNPLIKIANYQWYAIQYWIVPTTGWKTDYIFLNKHPKFIKITNEKIK